MWNKKVKARACEGVFLLNDFFKVICVAYNQFSIIEENFVTKKLI